MCAKVPKATNRQNNNSADGSMTGRKLKTTIALDSTDFYHVKLGYLCCQGGGGGALHN